MTINNSARICTVVCEQHACDLPQAITRAAEVADITELRLDCLIDVSPDRVFEACADLLQRAARPVIVTLRSPEEGGRQTIERSRRLEFWRSEIRRLMSFKEVFVDIEADIIRDLSGQEELSGAIDWRRVICSYHDFAGMPAEVSRIYDDLAATPAGILKIAARADDATDCIPIFRLLERARGEGREMIAIAMDAAGIATRILGPSMGAFLTYGSLGSGPATAPGQVSARELSELYRIREINSKTPVFSLLGNPVSHSISPHIHNAAFSSRGINAVYFPSEVHNAGEFIRRMVHPRSKEVGWNLRGLSVTAPHKSSVMQQLDWIEPAAKEIGAVNTIVVAEDALLGYNTDSEAFMAPLQRVLGPLIDVSCAIIGAGGAACTALWSFQRAGAQATLFARDPEAAGPLAQRFGVDCRALPEASFEGFEVVVNATPLGTIGEHQNEPVVLAAQLRGVRLVYDLVYNPTETLLLQEAARAGCACMGGLEMLVLQAAAQFKLWTGEDAPLSVMREAATLALDRQQQTYRQQSQLRI